MRSVLIWIVALEGAALLAAGLALLFGIEEAGAAAPESPVFRPPVYEAVIGDFVRYEKRDRETGEPLGYLEYKVLSAEILPGSTVGRHYILEMVEQGAGGGRRTRLQRAIPRSVSHGFLPPIFDEEARNDAPGAKPVVRSIRTAPVKIFKRAVPGFLLETVVPRESLTKVAERYWISQKVPVYGVARWETAEAAYEVLQMEWGTR
jgi:hypothetical protein